RVTGCASVKALRGIRQLFSWSLAAPSSFSRPSWTSCIAALAATGLLIDPAWKIVSGVAFTPRPASARPQALAQTTWPWSATATLIACRWWSAMASASVCRCSGRPTAWMRGCRLSSMWARRRSSSGAARLVAGARNNAATSAAHQRDAFKVDLREAGMQPPVVDETSSADKRPEGERFLCGRGTPRPPPIRARWKEGPADDGPAPAREDALDHQEQAGGHRPELSGDAGQTPEADCQTRGGRRMLGGRLGGLSVRFISSLALAAAGALGLAGQACAQAGPHILQQPAISRDLIAFSYAGDIWTVPRGGGRATRITTGVGVESQPLFSPDGRTLAFTGDYDGNTDVFTVPAGGGVPHRVTYHPAADIAVGWSRDGRRILF